MVDVNGVTIEWLGHASLRIRHGTVIYIDPFNLVTTDKADIILITHGHYDHCSIADISKVMTKDTLILGPPDCLSKLGKIEAKKVQVLAPGRKLTVGEIGIETVPAYNTNKEFHPKANEWMGYIVTVNNTRIYHAGDTDKIPEMSAIKADIAFMPVGGTYTMTAQEAADAVNSFKPKQAVPMHYGSIVGSASDAETFKKLCKVPVQILPVTK